MTGKKKTAPNTPIVQAFLPTDGREHARRVLGFTRLFNNIVS